MLLVYVALALAAETPAIDPTTDRWADFLVVDTLGDWPKADPSCRIGCAYRVPSDFLVRVPAGVPAADPVTATFLYWRLPPQTGRWRWAPTDRPR